jgi:hypothetical protein
VVVALVCFAASGYLWAQGQNRQTELAKVDRRAAEAGDQLADVKATNVSQANRIAEFQRQLDDTLVKQKNEELREIRSALDDLRKQMASMSPSASSATSTGETAATSDNQAAAEARRRAQLAWNEKVSTKRPYQTGEITKLYETWLDKEPAVAKRIKEWRTDVEGLRRRAKPWLSADAELKRLHDSATFEPWEDWLDRAKVRLESLRAAAAVWSNCATSEADPDLVIRNEPDETVQKVLKGWYKAAQTGGPWTLQLVRGYAARGANLGTTRVVTLAAAQHASAGTATHNWSPVAAEDQEHETNHDYLKDDAHGRLSFDWRPGESIELIVEGERGLFNRGVLLARPNLIDRLFDGPLAIWSLDQPGRVVSDDGNVALQFRIENCPGPPRDWNAEAAAGKKLKEEALGGVGR